MTHSCNMKTFGLAERNETKWKKGINCVRWGLFCTSIDSIQDDGPSLKSTIKFQSNSKIIMWSGCSGRYSIKASWTEPHINTRMHTRTTLTTTSNTHSEIQKKKAFCVRVQEREKRRHFIDGKSIFNRIYRISFVVVPKHYHGPKHWIRLQSIFFCVVVVVDVFSLFSVR